MTVAPPHARAATRSATRHVAAGLPWAIVAAIGLAGFAVVTALVVARVPLPFDRAGLEFARSLGVAPSVWGTLSDTANIPLIVIGFAIVAWLLFRRRWREALLVFLMLAAITAGSEGVKQLVARPRPSGTDPNIPGVVYSYPSGHVLEALTILGIITIRFWRSGRSLVLRALLVVLVALWVALVGLARVGLAAHYPSDVLGGLFGAMAALGIYGWFTRGDGAAERVSARPTGQRPAVPSR